MRRRPTPPPMALPGWGPMSAPTHPRPRPRGGRVEAFVQGAVPAVLGTLAVFRGAPHLQEGLVAAVVAAAPFLLLLGLWFTLKASPNRGRTLAEWVAVALVVVLLGHGTVTVPNVQTVADAKTPAERVDAAKGDLGQLQDRFAGLLDRVKGWRPTPSPVEGSPTEEDR